MNYAVFTKKAMHQDNRNTFAKCDTDLGMIPDDLKAFYREYNPVDVEIDYNGVGIRFYSVAELPELQNEYAYLHAQFIFATCNADPIFWDGGQVYTCPHGVKEPQWEKISDSFDGYLERLTSASE